MFFSEVWGQYEAPSHLLNTALVCIDGINEQTRVYKEAYSSLNFSGSLGKNHQVKFDH
jgi:hypothetical protein